MNIFCLVVWTLSLIVAAVQAVNKEPISPIVSICAMLVCIIYYLEKILGVM
jgi:hypothetical protein